MSINQEENDFIEQECQLLTSTVASLAQQQDELLGRKRSERVRARELTCEIVASTRIEDKAMLASDEAVSHGLLAKQEKDLKNLNKLSAKPYFARFEVLEEGAGDGKRLDYKLGIAANPECRILDWRSAPIARLFYEYNEGDHYEEEILGRERNGQILLKNSYEIEAQHLQKITCRYGVLSRTATGWQKSTLKSNRPTHQAGALPHILSVISTEDYRLITSELRAPLLIQGVAGSGKTSVAVHRLAWLLENFGYDARRVLILAVNPVLKRYLSESLLSLGISEVRVLTYREWYLEALGPHLRSYRDQDGSLRRPAQALPSSLARLKRSAALLPALSEVAKRFPQAALEENFCRALQMEQEILAHPTAKLLGKELLKECRERSAKSFARNELDWDDEIALLYLALQQHSMLYFESGESGRFQHILADEVQFLSPAEITIISQAVDAQQNLTLIGDTAQGATDQEAFPGWKEARQIAENFHAASNFINLQVSHRCSAPIMRLANYVKAPEQQGQVKGKEGRVPILMRCRSESEAVGAAINWLKQAMQRYPQALTAVVCPDKQLSKELFGLLKPTLANVVRLGNENDFSFDSGIVVCDSQSVRGLEFVNVLIWDPAHPLYSNAQTGRQQLYMLFTRASDNLCLIGVAKDNPFLPRGGNPLLRVAELQD